MPIKSEFTISLEDPVSQDVNISFDVIIDLKNGSTYTQPVSGVIKAGQSFTTIKINIPSLNYDQIEEDAKIINVNVNPPIFDLNIGKINFKKPPPPIPPPGPTRVCGGAALNLDVSALSPLRQAIVLTMQDFYNRCVREDPPTGGKGGSLAFNDKQFEADLRTVGWTPYTATFAGGKKVLGGAEWCNWTTKLVWKKAYASMLLVNPKYQDIIAKVYNNFTPKEGIGGQLDPNSKLWGCPIGSGVGRSFDYMTKSIPYIQTYCTTVLGNPYSKFITIKGASAAAQLEPGDMVCWSSFSHINICVEKSANSFVTIGGNEGERVSLNTNRKIPNGGVSGIIKPVDWI
jgi:hypothetical protein